MTEHAHDVPPRPAFVLRVQNDAHGAPTAWLDDEQVAIPPGVGTHRALIREARRRADRTRPGETIRVIGMTQDGDTFHLAIGPDGDAWEVPAPDEHASDAHAPQQQDHGPDHVPDDVAHVIELQEHDDQLIGLVDDEQIPLTRGEDPYDQLLRVARERADTHAAGRTVRVVGRTPDGRVWHIALAPDGTPQRIPAASRAASKVPPEHPAIAQDEPVNAFRPLQDGAQEDRAQDSPEHEEIPDEPEPQPAYIDHDATEPQTEPVAAPTAALTDDFGRPIPTTTTEVGAHRDYQPGADAGSDREPDLYAEDEPEPTSSARTTRRTLLLGGAGALVLVGAAAGGFFALRDDDTKTAPTPTVSGTQLPDGIRAPAGLPSSYLWSVVKLSDVAPQLAVTEKQLICTVDNDTTGGTQVVSFDAETGKATWKADLPVEAVVSHGPTLVPIDGTQSVLIGTQNQLLAYPLSGGDPKTWPLEPKWSVALTRSGVIITKPDDDKSAFILYADKLVRRALPEGSNPVAVLSGGTLVATDSRGRVWLVKDPKKVPKPKKLKAPRNTTPGTFVAATGDQLVTAFVPDDDSEASLVRAFSLPKLRPRITSAPIKPAVFPNNFMLAPDESWAVAGNTWIDMTTGDSHVIASKWSPIAISQHNSWSKSGDNVLTATEQGKSLGPAKQTSGQVSIPRGGTSKVAYCVASIGSDTTLYAVPLKD
ncbi:hypothetical protein [Flexivirga sp. B27]